MQIMQFGQEDRRSDVESCLVPGVDARAVISPTPGGTDFDGLMKVVSVRVFHLVTV